MPELEARYPCPVCLGVTMEKTPVGGMRAGRTQAAQAQLLLLDHCARCGGVWFEAGEVQRLRCCDGESLWKAIARRSELFRMRCHACHAFIDRDAAACPACGWRNVLDCPICQQPMVTATHQGVRLDACRSCKGVWFDHSELASIWRLELATSLQKRGQLSPTPSAAGDGALVVLDALVYSPWLMLEGMDAAGRAVAASAEALAHAPQAVEVAVEAAGDAAAGVFEAILDILGGLFS
jgi:Zn-finger nucleic acid-binding protein